MQHMGYGQNTGGMPQNQGQQFNPQQAPQQWYAQQQQQAQQGYYPQQMQNGKEFFVFDKRFQKCFSFLKNKSKNDSL